MIFKKIDARGYAHLAILSFVVIFAVAGVGYMVVSRAASKVIISSGASRVIPILGAYGQASPTKVGTSVFGQPITPIMESPPWIDNHNASNGWSSFLLTSDHSVACNVQANLATSQPINCTGVSNANMQTQADWLSYNVLHIPSSTPYQRNYLGAFSGLTLPLNGNYYLVTVNHGENKNDIEYNGGLVSAPNTGNNYQNTVKVGNKAYNPNANPPTGCSEVDWNNFGTLCQSGATLWQDNESYSGFISSSIVQETAANGWGNVAHLSNRGPIVWPQLGYGPFTTGINSFKYMGVRHPYMLAVGNYIYVYYLDTSGSTAHTGDGSGPDVGIKVARSSISNLGAMGSWYNYDPSNRKWDLPSLPSGITFNNVDSPTILNKKGPQEPPLWGSAPDTDGYVPVAFQVATIRNDSGHYLGIETEYNNSNGKWRAKLRTSTNLVSWANLVVVPASSGNGNTNGETKGELFSILLSNDGASNTVLSGYNPTTHTLPVYIESSIGSIPYVQPLTLQL